MADTDHPPHTPADGDHSGPERFRRLPDRVEPEDMVEEVVSEDPPPDDSPDPNREVAWRWGLGIAPGG